MLAETDALQIADVYGLGGDALLSGPVARGEVGQVWRLATSRGEWAVKEPFARPSTDEANDDAAFQDEVFASGGSAGAGFSGRFQVLSDTAREYAFFIDQAGLPY